MKLQGRNIVLTGASRGFGRYLAHILWEEGASLVLVSRHSHPAEHSLFVPQIGLKQRLKFVAADLAYPEEIINDFMGRDDIGDVHSLVNNAAIQGPIGPAYDSPWDAYWLTMTVNLASPIMLCRIVSYLMVQTGGGKIINLSGGGATSPRPNYSAYATSKAALVRFSECLALELKEKHIDVNCVAPGAMLTDMTRGQLEGKLTQEESDEHMRKAAELIVFLLSSESDGITGKLISAVHDPWQQHVHELMDSDIYTLRRLTPANMGLDWS